MEASICDFFVNLISSLHFNRVESILEGGVSVNNRSFWMRSIQYGAPESIDLVEPRKFEMNTAVLSALEGVFYELGLAEDSLRGYLPPTVEALLLAIFYYNVVNRSDEDQWIKKVANFVDQHVKPIMVEQRRRGLEDQDIYFAIMDDRKKCFEEWEIFQFSNSNSTQSDNLNKKRKKLPAFISEDIIEIVPPSKKPCTSS